MLFVKSALGNKSNKTLTVQDDWYVFRIFNHAVSTASAFYYTYYILCLYNFKTSSRENIGVAACLSLNKIQNQTNTADSTMWFAVPPIRVCICNRVRGQDCSDVRHTFRPEYSNLPSSKQHFRFYLLWSVTLRSLCVVWEWWLICAHLGHTQEPA